MNKVELENTISDNIVSELNYCVCDTVVTHLITNLTCYGMLSELYWLTLIRDDTKIGNR